MKKRFLGLIALSLLGAGYIASFNTNQPIVVRAEEAETYSISMTQPENGKIVIDESKLVGEVGSIVDVNVSVDMFYMVKSIKVNGNALIESETTKGLYSFYPVAGENVLEVEVSLDEKLFGTFTEIAEQVKNRDWTSLFSVANVLTIIKWVLDGGILIAFATYFIRDKKLSAKLELAVRDTLDKVVPETTKEAVLNYVDKSLTPKFNQLEAQNIEMQQAMSVFAKCMALSQENTPESRKAILDELATLKLGDLATIEQIKQYITEIVEAKEAEYQATLKALESIQQKSEETIKEQSVVSEPATEETEKEHYDGTSI